jgi:ribA/ribD-fused uncharacterized protein
MEKAKGTVNEFRGPFWFLSNFSDGGRYCQPTAEHQFQARKAREVRDAIWVMSAATPKEAKSRGGRIELVDHWEEIKVSVMREVLIAKFSDPELLDMLRATGDRKLVEGNSWGDRFWGVCRGEGLNWLGVLLMEIRDGV